jgi:hypothetical protein
VVTVSLVGKLTKVARQSERPLRVMELGRVAVTYDVCLSLAGGLGGDGPSMTVDIRCGPVVRGPDVAPMWPQWSPAWKARPVSSSWPDATPLPQLRASWDGPLLSVSNREMPGLRARGGHGR